MTRAERLAERQTELAATKAAIARILAGGQAYTAEGRQRANADLKQLEEREQRLQREIDKLTRGSAIGASYVRFS